MFMKLEWGWSGLKLSLRLSPLTVTLRWIFTVLESLKLCYVVYLFQSMQRERVFNGVMERVDGLDCLLQALWHWRGEKDEGVRGRRGTLLLPWTQSGTESLQRHTLPYLLSSKLVAIVRKLYMCNCVLFRATGTSGLIGLPAAGLVAGGANPELAFASQVLCCCFLI